MSTIITEDNLVKALGISTVTAQKWLQPLIDVCTKYEITTSHRICMFLAQIAHESEKFTHTQENLNYSAQGLVKTFPHYFSVSMAPSYVGHPDKIANVIYANRMGNGNATSGDGYKFRGRGLIQLTGKYMYAHCAIGLKLDLGNNPDLLLTPENAAASAGWFWSMHKLNDLSDACDIQGVTKVINGGLIGLTERQSFYNQCRKIFI